MKTTIHIFKRIDTFVDTQQLLKPNSTIIIGLSGGPDSVLLLHYLASRQALYQIKLIVAHVDHQWRKNSGDDVYFCKTLAAQYNLPYHHTTYTAIAKTYKLKERSSKEDMARQARRAYFAQLAATYDADSIALGHHADDQQETFFIRLLRGASLTGLCSIWPQKDGYIRPLLQLNKQEIIHWLDEQRYPYLTDETNQDQSFLRNRIRTQLMPLIRSLDDRWDTNSAKTIGHLQQTERLLQDLTRITFDQITEQEPGNPVYKLRIEQLLALDSAMQYRIIVHWLTAQSIDFPVSQGFFDELLRFARHACCDKKHQIANWSLVIADGWLQIEKA